MRKFLALLLLFVFLFGSVLAQHHSGGGDDNEHGGGNHNGGGVCPSGTSAPTEHASQPTSAPTHHASNPSTEAPTQAPTHHASNPTTAPTQAPTHHASNPTTAPTQAPTHHASNPTTAPTQAPSSGSSSGSSTDLCSVTPTSSEPVTILVPLYVDPGSEWDELITAANGGAKILAIINPDSGPVSSGPDSSYTTYMQKFTDAGIEMVGYIHTEYGDRAISEIESEVDTYSSKYPGLKGIFLDEVSADASEISYYTQAYNYILSKSGYVYDIINPGTQPDQGYLNAATTIVVFESEASQFAGTQFSSWVSCAPSASEKSGYKYKFGAIAYGASQSQLSTLLTEMINDGMGYVYVTDGAGGCCTYNDLVSFFSTEATTVQGLN